MQIREIGEGICKGCHNEGTKEMTSTETELKNRDHNGHTYKEQKKKRAKIWE